MAGCAGRKTIKHMRNMRVEPRVGQQGGVPPHGSQQGGNLPCWSEHGLCQQGASQSAGAPGRAARAEPRGRAAPLRAGLPSRWALAAAMLALAIVAALALPAVPAAAATATAAAAPSLEAKAFILVDADTGAILYENNADSALVPASMTKLMTLYLALEGIAEHRIGWTDQVEISEYSNKISRQPSLSSFQLPAGKSYTVRELFYAAALNSSNAAAIALAEHIGGTEGQFVDMMNSKARSFGLADVKFVNSSGLNNSDLFGNHPPQTAKNEDTKLSARSMAAIAYRLINDYPEYESYSSQSQRIIRADQPDQIIVNSTNKLLPGKQFATDGVKGMKTGYTFNAGFCFAGYAVRKSGRFISVVMGAATTNERFLGSARLLEYGFKLADAAPDGDGAGATDAAAAAASYLYPDRLNYYLASRNPYSAAGAGDGTAVGAGADGSSAYVLSYGDTGFGVMKNGKTDVLMINGLMYSVSQRGRVSALGDGSGVGAAAMTYFNRDGVVELGGGLSLAELEGKLGGLIGSGESYCFKIEGSFAPTAQSSVSAALIAGQPANYARAAGAADGSGAAGARAGAGAAYAAAGAAVGAGAGTAGASGTTAAGGTAGGSAGTTAGTATAGAMVGGANAEAVGGAASDG
ncbi:MAG: D-alanyl-D-alanine carboxypeptidase, partial [Clostridiales bacterium]|nr:D-alanyl-D-alanine carboxypeptidase [Clostridiales bacterium]